VHAGNGQRELELQFLSNKDKGGDFRFKGLCFSKKKEEEKVKIFGSIGKKESAGFRDEREEL
jgi:hypothetical protein